MSVSSVCEELPGPLFHFVLDKELVDRLMFAWQVLAPVTRIILRFFLDLFRIFGTGIDSVLAAMKDQMEKIKEEYRRKKIHPKKGNLPPYGN